MKQKHKNAEYIVAFANGEAVQYIKLGLKAPFDQWDDVMSVCIFEYDGMVFRMKPKTVITKGYKRYAFQDHTSGEWFVDTYTEGCTYSLDDGEVWIDKEWQYYTFEEEG